MNLPSFQQKLPEIRAWIDGLLAEHATQARAVGGLGFTRLSSYYSPALLSAAKVIPVPRCPAPPLGSMGLPGFADFEQINAAGITFLSAYFVRSDCVRDESLHFHELVHVIQWQHLGPDRFILAYALGHQRCGYRANPLEVMAYALQRCFDVGAGAFDVEAVVRRELGPIVAALEARA